MAVTVHLPALSSSEINRRVAANIRRYRMAAGLRQSDLAEALGMTAQQVQKYERGVNNPRVGHLDRMARRMGITVAALFDDPPGDEPPAVDPGCSRLFLELMRTVQRMPLERQMLLAQTARMLAEDRPPRELAW